MSLILGLLSTTGVWLFGRKIDNLKTVEVDTLKTNNKEIRKKFESSEKMRLETEEKLKNEIIETKKKLGRSFTDEQKKQFVEFLTTKIKGEVNIKIAGGDGEALAFAEAIKDLLIKAGWKIAQFDQILSDNPIKGIILSMKHESSMPPRFFILEQVFKSIGITPRLERQSNYQEQQVSITVGHKPSN